MSLFLLAGIIILILNSRNTEPFNTYPIEIDALKAKKLLNERRALLIDVRSMWERKEGHHPASLFIPHNHIRRDHQSLKGVQRHTPIITHCKSGVRARAAATKLKEIGFQNVFYITTDYKSLL